MYEEYAAAGVDPAAVAKENTYAKPEEIAPRAFGLSEEEQQCLQAQLSPEAQKMLLRRDQAVAEILQQALNELQIKHFLDRAFAQKGKKYGFKDAKEWMEKLIMAEDMLEQNPEQTLRFLADSYGINWNNPAAGGAPLQSAAELLLTRVAGQLQQLQDKFDQKERREASLRASADDAKRAKEAAFAPQGKKPAPEDLSNLTTREILERQFALLDD